jgi:hypothetical protein
MTEHIDVPLEVIEDLMKRVTAGEKTEVLGILLAIRGLLVDPNVRSIFGINSASLIHHQMNRIEELEKAVQKFYNDIHYSPDLVEEFGRAFSEWMINSKAQYVELTKDLVR